MTWIHDGEIVEELPVSCVGFVYKITRLSDGKFYIGKKLATRCVVRQIKGKRRRQRAESKWRDYWGSSRELQADVALLGTSSFRREILQFCDSKGLCSYHEARLQFEYRVLERDDSYNNFIGCKIHKKHLQPNHLTAN